MKPATGQILRLTGLMVEVPCVLGLFSLKQGKLGEWTPGPFDPASWLSVGVAVGFVLWVAGTVVIYWPRPKGPPGRSAELDLGA